MNDEDEEIPEGIRILRGTNLEQIQNLLLKTHLAKNLLSKPIGEWFFGDWESVNDIKIPKYPLYLLRYEENNVCIITVIDWEEKYASLNWAYKHKDNVVVSASWHFMNGRFTHEIERNFMRGIPTQEILESIAKKIKDYKKYFLKLEPEVQDCLREAYDLADRL